MDSHCEGNCLDGQGNEPTASALLDLAAILLQVAERDSWAGLAVGQLQADLLGLSFVSGGTRSASPAWVSRINPMFLLRALKRHWKR